MTTSYFVLLDSNVWTAERLLLTSMGSAFLFSTTSSSGTIILPEIVEREVTSVLLDQGEKAVSEMSQSVRFLRQMSGHTLNNAAPTSKAIAEGIRSRWNQLEGRIRRVAFDFEQAKAALERIYRSIPPCGPNNEQFRDCCLWEIARLFARTMTVHFVTADTAFYQGRDYKSGLSNVLKNELQADNLNIRVHAKLSDFLSAIEASSPKFDPEALKQEISEPVLAAAEKRAAGNHPRDLVRLVLRSPLHIKGYATPSNATIAVSFEARYHLRRTVVGEDKVAHSQTEFDVQGTCSYDPNTKVATDVVVDSWSEFDESSSGLSHGRFSAGNTREFAPDQRRLIT